MHCHANARLTPRGRATLFELVEAGMTVRAACLATRVSRRFYYRWLPRWQTAPVTVSGTGPDETAALRDLDDRLRGVPQPDGSRVAERERRFRQAYLAGAEERSRETLGTSLTGDELEGVIRRFRYVVRRSGRRMVARGERPVYGVTGA